MRLPLTLRHSSLEERLLVGPQPETDIIVCKTNSNTRYKTVQNCTKLVHADGVENGFKIVPGRREPGIDGKILRDHTAISEIHPNKPGTFVYISGSFSGQSGKR